MRLRLVWLLGPILSISGQSLSVTQSVRAQTAEVAAGRVVPQDSQTANETRPSVTELGDTTQIRQLMASYVWAVDEQDATALACLFAPEGIAEIGWNDSGTLKMTSSPLTRQDIYAVTRERSLSKSAEGVRIHNFGLDPLIDVRADTATLEFHILRLINKTSSTSPPSGGVARPDVLPSSLPAVFETIHSDLIKLQGRWKIKVLRVTTEIAGPPVRPPHNSAVPDCK